MKNSKEYSRKIQKLYHSLKKKYPKTENLEYEEPVDALVYAIVSEGLSGSAARAAMKRFNDYFVDLNDLRVSRAEEIVEMLGEDTPATRQVALRLTTLLRAIFDKYNMVNLVHLKKQGKKQARQILEKFDGTNPFAINFCMVTALQGHAIALTQPMIDYLKKNELVYPDSEQDDIEGFLARQIGARKAYEFYVLLRRESESQKPAKKKKTTTKKKTKKKETAPVKKKKKTRKKTKKKTKMKK